MEFIAGDGGVIKLAVVADLVYQAADLIVALDGLHDGLIGNVDAKLFMQGLKNMGAQLLTEVSIAVLIVLEGNVGEFAEEIIVVDNSHILDGVKVLLLKVLLEAAGAGAGLGRHLRIEEVEAALESSLKKASCIVADTRGHIVGRNVGGSAARRTQTNCEAAGQVEKNFRHEIAGVTYSVLAVGLGLLDKLVIGFLKQILKVDQMLEIFHR